MIANMLGLSLFWYQATIFDFPKTVIFRVNKLLFHFVWNKKSGWHEHLLLNLLQLVV